MLPCRSFRTVKMCLNQFNDNYTRHQSLQSDALIALLDHPLPQSKRRDGVLRSSTIARDTQAHLESTNQMKRQDRMLTAYLRGCHIVHNAGVCVDGG